MQSNKAHIPQILYTFCKHTFIFEIMLTSHNLKEGFQTYTVTRTFIQKNIIQHDPLLKEIKQVIIALTKSESKALLFWLYVLTSESVDPPLKST